jgi:hypothetical protein
MLELSSGSTGSGEIPNITDIEVLYTIHGRDLTVPLPTPVVSQISLLGHWRHRQKHLKQFTLA